MLHCGLVIVLFYRFFSVIESVTLSEVERHLELGKQLLAKGQLQDALTHYHAALDGDSNNYLTLYKRGTIYLALNKPKVALGDFDKVLELKPDFTAARVSRGSVLFKQARFDLARNDINIVLAADPYNEVALDLASKIGPIREEVSQAKVFLAERKYDKVVDTLTRVINVCSWAPEFRELRAEAHEALGDDLSAISDIRLATKLLPDDTKGHYKLGGKLYKLGLVDEALEEVRNCLKLDPEHKQCMPLYRKIKSVSKKVNSAASALEAREFNDCIADALQILKLEETNENVRFEAHYLLCRCYLNDPEPARAVKSCEAALKVRRDPVVLCDSVEAHLAAEMYDDAIRAAKEAMELDSNLQRAKDLLEKAQKLQKISETRDYYKILGVKRSATKKEITKAYRKAAQTWHPDNFLDPDEKKLAEKKFIDIAAAKEVLTNDEKREKFDRGEDPLDPESGKQQSPFQDFNHFQGSPFQFRFHFN